MQTTGSWTKLRATATGATVLVNWRSHMGNLGSLVISSYLNIGNDHRPREHDAGLEERWVEEAGAISRERIGDQCRNRCPEPAVERDQPHVQQHVEHARSDNGQHQQIVPVYGGQERIARNPEIDKQPRLGQYHQHYYAFTGHL